MYLQESAEKSDQAKVKNMDDKEYNKINKEIEEWNEFKEKIKEKVNIVSLDNYDEDSIIFTILKINKKKEKKSFIKFIQGSQENIFSSTLNAMNDYFEEKIKKEYIKIEDIPSLQNIFGIIKDRIKSNEESIKYSKKEAVKHQKQLQKEKNYDKIEKLNSELFWDKHHIESHKGEIMKYQDLLKQFTWDVQRVKEREEVKE